VLKTELESFDGGSLLLLHFKLCVLLCFINPILGDRYGTGAS